MDPRLLEYYTSELLYLRELAGEFAQAHPKIARRLGMQAGEIGDTYVERLVESFAFMSARMQIRLDDDFPRFTHPLLQAVYPNYLSPTPSMSVARLYPGGLEGDLRTGYRVARGTAFSARVPDGESTSCEFRSSQDVTLYPLEITEARLTGVPPDIPALGRYVWPGRQVRGACVFAPRTAHRLRPFRDWTGCRSICAAMKCWPRTCSNWFTLQASHRSWANPDGSLTGRCMPCAQMPWCMKDSPWTRRCCRSSSRSFTDTTCCTSILRVPAAFISLH